MIDNLMMSLLQDGPAYIRVFVHVLRDIFKEETVEYVLALVDEMLAGDLRERGILFYLIFMNCECWRFFSLFCSESEKG